MTTELAAMFEIKVSGSPMAPELYEALHQATVDTSLHMPDMAILQFRTNDLGALDSASIAEMGAEIEIWADPNASATPDEEPASLFKGKVAAVEADFSEGTSPKLVVRAYHQAYALHMGTHYRSFVNMTDSDIVSKIVPEVGLSAQSESTSQVHKHVFQGNVSNWDFLQERARLNGYLLVGRGTQVRFVRPESLQEEVIEVTFGENLIDFNATMTLAGQVTEAKASAWDQVKKAAIVSTVSSQKWETTTANLPANAKSIAALSSGGSKLLLTVPAAAQGATELIAQAGLDSRASQRMRARGRVFGHPKLLAGNRVKLIGVGQKFSGEYTLTRTRHTLTMKDRYTTEFWVGGMDSGTLASTVFPTMVERDRAPVTGLVSAIVTNVADEDDIARVKVKYPWLDDSQESGWARLVSPMAGAGRGLLLVPEVNDEVVVGFLHGDFNSPYVLGSVWNSVDKAALGHGKFSSSGKITVRQLKTREGHTLTFDDSKHQIEVKDSKGNFILLDGQEKSISIESKGDLTIKAVGAIKIEGKSIDMKATMGDVKMKGMNVLAEGSAKLSLKAPLMDAVGSGPVTIKGATVMIN